MTGADVVVRAIGRSETRFARRWRASARAGRVGIVSRRSSSRRWCDRLAWRRLAWSSCGPWSRRSRSTGTMTLQGKPYSHELLRDHGVLVRPELLAQLNLRVGDDLLIGTPALQIRGVIQSEPGPQSRSVLARLASLHRPRRSAVDRSPVVWQPCVPSVAAAGAESSAAAGTEGSEPLLATELSKAFVNDFVGVRSYPAERRAHEPEPLASGELSQPRGTGRPHSGWHRRLERDAGVRPAEGPKHCHPQVRWQQLASGPGDLPDAGRAAGPRGQRARRRDRGGVLQLLPCSSATSPRCCRSSTGSPLERCCRVWPSACSCRCCSRSCRCSRCAM